jgi:hypothetical protein
MSLLPVVGEPPQLIKQAIEFIDEVILLLEEPRWYTPERWKEETGEAWPDNNGVFTRLVNRPNDEWDACLYGKHKIAVNLLASLGAPSYPLYVVCATEAGPPPDDWKPEGEV